MNQVALAVQDSVHRIGNIPADLEHPQPVCLRPAADDLHLSRRQLNEKQHDETLQTSPGPYFHGEEICGHNQFLVPAQELLPGRLSAPLRCRLDPVPLQNLGDRAAGYLMPQVGQCALDPMIAPIPVLFGHSNHQSLDLACSARSPGSVLSTAVVLLGN